MKKFTSTDLGGAPINKNDLRDIFNSEIWDAVQAVFSKYDTDTEGLVISGCLTTANGGNFDMTAGIVYMNGEFMRIAAATNQSFTKYIAPSAVVNDSRTFADSNSHVVAVTKNAELVGSIPGAGQYLVIASLTDLDASRWRPALLQDLTAEAATRSAADIAIQLEIGTQNPQGLVFKSLTIPAWDMDTTAVMPVAHGLSVTELGRICSMDAIIRPDAIDQPARLFAVSAAGQREGYLSGTSTTNLSLGRTTGGVYDDPGFSSTGFSRGRLLISYIPD
jgi:hypothetical protein